jgi:hypothetical protein
MFDGEGLRSAIRGSSGLLGSTVFYMFDGEGLRSAILSAIRKQARMAWAHAAAAGPPLGRELPVRGAYGDAIDNVSIISLTNLIGPNCVA